MSLFEIGFLGLALFFVVGVAFYAWRSHRRASACVSCYVDRRENPHFYRTDEYVDSGFSPKQKWKAFIDAKKKCAVCKSLTFFGEADTRREHFIGLIRSAKEGQLHHIVPRKYRGRSIAENAAWLCGPCNIAISDEWTKESERLCLKHNWTVHLDEKDRCKPLRTWREIVRRKK